MPLPTPHENEEQSAWISRCMGNETMMSDFPEQEQRVAVCYSLWRDKKMPQTSTQVRKAGLTPNNLLLKSIRKRERKRTEFNYGITTADRYVRTMQQAIGLNSCYKHISTKSRSFHDIVSKASRTLVYSNPDMEVLSKEADTSSELLEGIDLPKNWLMVFQHVLTTPRKDRDGDILRTQGASVDPNMLLLWQHIPTLPIGKMLGIVEHTQKRLVLVSAIVDLGDLAHDSAVMIDNKMGRFSHGFNVREYEELKDSNGFDIKKYEILEESLVSIPSNVDAETLDVVLSLVEGGKLHSGVMKQYGKSLREKLPLKLPSGIDLKELPDENELGSRSPQESGEDAESIASKETKADAGAETKEDSQNSQVNVIGPYVRKQFDIELEHLEASQLEYAWASRWLNCQIKEMEVVSTYVPTFRMGSFLTGLKNCMQDWESRDIRNLTYAGKEEPPRHTAVQLNSKLSNTFLIDGIEFLKTTMGESICVKRSSGYGGVEITTYVKRGTEVGADLVNGAWEWAFQNNFLKGEAFSLGGDFVKRTALGWDDIFLEEGNKKIMQRAGDLLNRMGASMPSRGVLVFGSPGTGKTMAGRILLNETNATMIWVSARDFYNRGAVGGICAAYDLAKELAPAIVFIEDIDNWMSDYAVDVIKTEMDGLDKNSGILTIMTTNYPERLPDALIDRPGRFHDVALFDLPGEKIRQAMLQRWAGELTIEEAAQFAKETDGYSGAHIFELVAFAKMLKEENPEMTVVKSLETALAKIDEQRKLIGDSQIVKPYGKSQTVWSKALTLPGTPEVEFKAGRVLSKKSCDALCTVRDDLREVLEKDESLSRGSRALLQRSIAALEELVASEDESESESEMEDSEDEKTITAEQAMAIFLGKSNTPLQLKLLSILKTLAAIQERDSKITEFRSLLER